MIDIVRQEIVSPVFARPYYRGVYSPESKLQFNEVISLSHGFDASVEFDLGGGNLQINNFTRVIYNYRSDINRNIFSSRSTFTVSISSHGEQSANHRSCG